MTWWRIRFLVPTAFADASAWLLAAQLDHPAEVQDGSTMSKDGDASHSAVVMAFTSEPDAERLEETIRNVLSTFGVALAAVETQRSDDQSWREGWRAFFRSARLSDRVSVHPPWEQGIETPVRVTIEPGMAFGTGTHATTRGCMKMLDSLLADRPSMRILDVGCGSAILAIAAALMGHSVVGVDIDGDALKSAADNLKLNAVETTVTLVEGTAASIGESFPVVIANILAPILIENAEAISERCATDLILSGLMSKHESDVVAAYHHFTVVERLVEGEWVVLHMARTK